MSEQGDVAAARVAVVTGAGTGIGRAAALALADRGWTVVAVGRRPAPLQELTTQVRGDGRIRPRATDVTDPTAVDALFADVVADGGRVDVLFNNAGVFTAAHLPDEIPLEDWHHAVGVNLTGAFLCARAAFGVMRRQSPRGGRIINNGSISAQVPRPWSLPYTTTKHAITGLTRSLALDGRPYDIACGQIDIGNAATEMTDGFSAGVRQADGSLRAEARMDVADVARAVVYMAELPLSATVLSMTVMATGMPFVGRG